MRRLLSKAQKKALIAWANMLSRRMTHQTPHEKKATAAVELWLGKRHSSLNIESIRNFLSKCMADDDECLALGQPLDLAPRHLIAL
jgi:hypothetical protein